VVYSKYFLKKYRKDDQKFPGQKKKSEGKDISAKIEIK